MAAFGIAWGVFWMLIWALGLFGTWDLPEGPSGGAAFGFLVAVFWTFASIIWYVL